MPVFSQSIPTIKIKDQKDLELSELKINIEIVGNYAKTTYDMMFYNPQSRVLEGELVFPLAQGQSVSNFAMEVNGNLREAIVIEKTQARVAYKNTMVQRIDPGLLEKTEGNNYKARIYPINAKAYKHVLISTEELLISENGEKIYNAPLDIKSKLKRFEIKINVVATNKPYFKPNPFGNFVFKKRNHKYMASWSKKNFTPKKSFKILIPESLQNPEVITYKDYFYVYIPIQKNYRSKSKPKHIAVYWDASLSGMNRDTQRELELLLSYIKYLNNVDLDLYIFSSRIQQKYTLNIINGKTKILSNLIKSIAYDGGTSFALLNKIDTKSFDEILLFSDGLNNLGDWKNLPEKPIYTVNSAVNAHHDLLQHLADATGGDYLNLNTLDNATALDNLKILPLKFLGVSENEDLFEVFPAKNKAVSGSFVLAGRFTAPVKFDVNFGYAGQVDYHYQIDLSTAGNDLLAKRLWAKQKLLFLQIDKKKNKEKIVGLAMRYHLISDYTSMIILDRVEDYVRYNIEPPADLRARYKQLLARQNKNARDKKEVERENFRFLQEEYQEVIDWYTGKTKAPDKPIQNEQTNRQTNQQQENEVRVVERQTPPREGTYVLHGVVYDKTDNSPMPGINVLIKGTQTGAATDFDGKFTIHVKSGDVLVFSNIGYKTEQYTIQNETNLEISLAENSNRLQEVVITGARGIREKPNEVSYAQQVVKAEDITASQDGVKLSEKVAGVTINNANNGIRLRGGSELIGKITLYIFDGLEVKQEEIDAKKVAKVTVMFPPLSVILYGNKGRNGAILFYTKKYLRKHRTEIKALEKKIKEYKRLAVVKSKTYMNKLQKAKTLDEAYYSYLKMRKDYLNKPVYFIDVSDYFYKYGKKEKAIQIITNLAELKLANHELSRALAYKLEAYGMYDMAVKVYQNVLELRPEEPQSYRDLALAYELNGEYQKSFDILYNMYKGKNYHISGNDNFEGIEMIVFVELHHLVSLHGDEITLPKDAQIFKEPMTMDVRVVIDWNHNDTDIDLWAFDPNNEKAFYKHKLSKIGGRISDDFTDGYGPETYTLKKAIKGMYNFEVDYYSDSVQKVSGATILKVTIFKNYGKPNETRKTILTRLDKKERQVEVGSLGFK